MAKPRILVVGSANMDLVLKTERVPEAGETLISGGSYEFCPGGKGANAAIAAHNMGADVMFCSRLGNDLHGTRMKKLYQDQGMDTRYVKLDKNRSTGLAGILVESDGQNRIIVYSGANMGITDDDVEEAFMSYPDAVLLQFEISDYIVQKTVKMANEKGIPVFVDAGPARKDYPLFNLGKLEVFSPNETETAIFTGIKPSGLNDYIKAGVSLSSKVQAKYYVLKLGSRGAYVYDGKYSEILPAYDVEVVDTTAAGDAFTAALTVEYIKTKDIVRAAKVANAAGALAITKQGAYTSLPTQEEVYRFINEKNINI